MRVSVSLSVLGVLCAVSQQCGADPNARLKAHLSKREHAIARETSVAIGASLEPHFTPAERRADSVLRAAKSRALSPQADGEVPIASQHFFDAKPRIERTDLFPMLKKMPKGAVLHLHPDAVQDVSWVVKNATYDDRLWLCGELNTGLLNNSIQFKFTDAASGPSAADCTSPSGWRRVVALRNASLSHEEFDASLVAELTVITDRRPPYTSLTAAWTKFQSCFGNVNGLVFFQEFHTRYNRAALQAFADDGVQHVEIRQTIVGGTLYTSNGTVLPLEATIQAFQDAGKEVGVTTRVILAGMRHASPDSVAAEMKTTRQFMDEFPGYVVGFDLVGQEDPGYPLATFLPELLGVARNSTAPLPYFFHAGETDEVGQAPDLNLFDAVLLNTSRIGHGFGLARHPDLRQEVARQGIAIEVCPLSNQVLFLVDDLRNHPGPTQWVSEGVMPLTISPDDPALWGATGVSYDWFQFFLASGNSTGLGLLKQLALNSWTYSNLRGDELKSGITEWERRWDAWVSEIGASS